jgi:hypothetical protein
MNACTPRGHYFFAVRQCERGGIPVYLGWVRGEERYARM